MRGSDMTFKLDQIYGYCELKEFYRLENGRIVGYGYRIDYDQHGKETGRTESFFPLLLSYCPLEEIIR